MKAVADVQWVLHLDPNETWIGVKSGTKFVIDRVESVRSMPSHVEVSGFLVKSDGTVGKARRMLWARAADQGGFPDDGRVFAEIARLRSEAALAKSKFAGGAA
jgi:hypothetical protein